MSYVWLLLNKMPVSSFNRMKYFSKIFNVCENMLLIYKFHVILDWEKKAEILWKNPHLENFLIFNVLEKFLKDVKL